jgi:DNA-binding GntR family transcriptional regulator
MLQRGTGERNRDALVMLLAGIAGSSDRVVIVGNAYLDRFLVQLEHAVRHFGKTSYAYAGWPPRSLEEHRAIIEAIINREPQQVGAGAAEQMRSARQVRAANADGRILSGWPE